MTYEPHTIAEFIEAVRKMRAYQKQYFSTRNSNVLAKSQFQEGKVDEMLAKFLGQTQLFDK